MSTTDPNDDLDPLKGRVNELGALRACEACGATAWAWGQSVVAVPNIGRREGTEYIDSRQGISALPVVCTSCGLVRLHAVNVLRGENT